MVFQASSSPLLMVVLLVLPTPVYGTGGTCSGKDYECYPGLCYDQEGECICNNGVDTLDTDRSAGDCPDDCEDKMCLDEQHLCYDIAGKCMCANGYKMDGDKCVDLCSGLPCMQNNLCAPDASTPGKDCVCKNGFRLGKDGDCNDDCGIKPCLIEQDLCEDIDGTCTCKRGLKFDRNEERCVDDCAGRDCKGDNCLPINGVCTCMNDLVFDNEKLRCVLPCYGRQCYIQNLCENKFGKCVCKGGLLFDQDEEYCLGPDVCAGLSCRAENRCAPDSNGERCICVNGYSLSGVGNCVDINECTTGKVTCAENADCVNNVGSYTCICSAGYDFISGRCTKRPEGSNIIYIILGVSLAMVIIISVGCCCFLVLCSKGTSHLDRVPQTASHIHGHGVYSNELYMPPPRRFNFGDQPKFRGPWY